LRPLLRARFGKPSTKRIHAPSAPERSNCEGFPITRRHEAARPDVRRPVLRFTALASPTDARSNRA
jgi:hypothetical protein